MENYHGILRKLELATTLGIVLLAGYAGIRGIKGINNKIKEEVTYTQLDDLNRRVVELHRMIKLYQEDGPEREQCFKELRELNDKQNNLFGKITKE